MAIVDQFGSPYANPYSNTAAHGAARNNGLRPWEPVKLHDISKLVPTYDRQTLLSASRRLYLNQEILKGAVEQKGMYAVGKAWAPKFTGEDQEFGKAATDWLTGVFYPLCDVQGPVFDFRTELYLISLAVDRDGECFIVLTETKDGFPKIQHIPSHRVGNPRNVQDGPITSGSYRNANLRDGIAYNRVGTPVAFAYLDENFDLIQWVSLRDAIHVYDPSWQEQGRGLPAFTASINKLRDAMQSHDLETMAQAMLSGRVFIEWNETGGPDTGDPAFALTGSSENGSQNPGVQVENINGPMNTYYRANSGSKLETFHNPRPGEAWESFQDRIIRGALAGVNWPYSLVWKASGQGTAERHEIAKAQRAIEDRQALLTRPALAIISWAVAKAQKAGMLPQSPEWYKWTFTMPRKLTIDDGRASKEQVDGFRSGYINHEDILADHGKTLEEHYDARAREVYLRKQAAEKWSIDGIEIEDREMCMLTPNEQSAEQMEAAKSKPTKEEE
jgi:hypothetical protein